jgi:hypothetical protein
MSRVLAAPCENLCRLYTIEPVGVKDRAGLALFAAISGRPDPAVWVPMYTVPTSHRGSCIQQEPTIGAEHGGKLHVPQSQRSLEKVAAPAGSVS